MNTKKYIFGSIALLAVAGLISGATAFAADTNQPNAAWGHMRSGMKPAVFGTVSAVNGNTITVNGKQGGPGMMNGSASATTVFTVDASNATVIKDNATSSVSAILTGDTVSVQGTINGTNITATMIRDGMMRGGAGGMGSFDKTKRPGGMPSSTLIQGNGHPVLAGTISAINGSTLSLTNKSNLAYTVDVTNAKLLRGQNTIALSSLNVGDSVVVQGAVNGNSVAASTVIDQTMPASSAVNQPNSGQQPNRGFFGGILNFFKGLFGF